MSEIKRAVVKSYDAVAHKAAVQIAGSLAVWLDAVRVATNIPPADVVAGRQCTVLFLDPSNQDEAVIIAIQGAAPSGGGASDHKVIVSADDTTADYLEGKLAAGTAIGLTTLNPGANEQREIAHAQVASGDLHTEYARPAAAETWAGLQTFNAGIQLAAGQAVKDSGGTDRLTPATASPHVTLAGDIRAGDRLSVGIAPTSTITFRVDEGGSHSVNLIWANIGVGTVSITAAGVGLDAVSGNAIVDPGTNTGVFVRSLNYKAGVASGGAGATARVDVVTAKSAFILFTGTVDPVRHYYVPSPQFSTFLGSLAIPNIIGLDIDNIGKDKVTNAIAIRVADIKDATTINRLLELGKNPELRLESGDPPDAALATEGDSNLYLAWMENGTVTLRQVRWRQQSSLGAGDRVLIV